MKAPAAPRADLSDAPPVLPPGPGELVGTDVVWVSDQSSPNATSIWMAADTSARMVAGSRPRIFARGLLVERGRRRAAASLRDWGQWRGGPRSGGSVLADGVPAGHRARSGAALGVAVHEQASAVDAYGRDIMAVRHFCLPYRALAERPVSYEALYEALLHVQLPAQAPVQVEVPTLDPHEIAGRVGGLAINAAAWLLHGERVCVATPHAVPLRERLRLLDTVTALLPYGMRATMSAATWVTAMIKNPFLLSFAEFPAADATVLDWDGPRGRERAVNDYAEALSLFDGSPGMIARLAEARTSQRFNPEGQQYAREVVENARPLTAGFPSGAFLEELLIECADALDGADDQRQRLVFTKFARATANTPLTEKDRRPLLAVAENRRLLVKRSRPPSRLRELYDSVLPALCGDELTLDGLIAVEHAARTLHFDLAEALRRLPASEPTVELMLVHRQEPERLAMSLARMDAEDVVAAAALSPPRDWLIEPALKELRTRRGDAQVRLALSAHGFLADQLADLHPGRADVQIDNLLSLLRACYGDKLSPSEFDEVLGGKAQMPPAALLATAMLMHGRKGPRRLLRVTLPELYANAGCDGRTLERLNRLTLPWWRSWLRTLGSRKRRSAE